MFSVKSTASIPLFSFDMSPPLLSRSATATATPDARRGFVNWLFDLMPFDGVLIFGPMGFCHMVFFFFLFCVVVFLVSFR